MALLDVSKEELDRIAGWDPDYKTDQIYEHITPLTTGGSLAAIDRANAAVLVDSDVFTDGDEFERVHPELLSTTKVLSSRNVKLMIPIGPTSTVKRARAVSVLPAVPTSTVKRSRVVNVGLVGPVEKQIPVSTISSSLASSSSGLQFNWQKYKGVVPHDQKK